MSSSPQRFILRKEYFGGIILDSKTTTYELLDPKEFSFFASLMKGKEFCLKELNSQLKKTVKVLQQKDAVNVNNNGRISMVDTRFISPPDKLPEKCLSAPIKVYDTYTRRCNLGCKQCYASSSAAFSEIRRTIEQTEIVMRKFYEVGVIEWRFTGGEPTICPDLFEAINIAKSFRMAVSLNTNGCWNEDTSRKVFDSGIDTLVISLEGREEINDKRRRPGVFKQVMKILEKIANHNKTNPGRKIKVILNMAVGRDNVGNIEFVARLAASYGFNVNFVPLKSAGRAASYYQNTILSTDEYMGFVKEVQKLREDLQIKNSGIKLGLKHKDLFCPDYPDKSKLPYPFQYSECEALSTAISLLPDGRVFACPFLMDRPEFIGPNVLEVSVYEAWLHSNIERYRRAEKIDCLDCRFFMKQCRGKCRAAVLLNKGKIENKKLIGKDPYCFAALMPK